MTLAPARSPQARIFFHIAVLGLRPDFQGLTIQPHLPAGWSGGDQLAIHGTSEPWTIGKNASAGCVHVSEKALHELEPILRLGTPVIITP